MTVKGKTANMSNAQNQAQTNVTNTVPHASHGESGICMARTGNSAGGGGLGTAVRPAPCSANDLPPLFHCGADRRAPVE
eukprot:3644309-Amphidinium_carterae.3